VAAQAISVLCISTSAAANRAGLGLASNTNYTFATAGKAGKPGKRLNTRPITGTAGNMGFGYHYSSFPLTDTAAGEKGQDAKGVFARSLAKGTSYLDQLLLNGRLFIFYSSSACHSGHLLLCLL